MKTLVIMAAGMGSRFGGLKQIEPIGPNGEFIIDYSIYDAIRLGFQKLVFVIKEENYEIFKEKIGKKIEDKIKVCYAFQKLSDIPDGYDLGKRKKPLGTAHALYAARDFIDDSFAVINADDFYGYNSLKEISNFLDKKQIENEEIYALVGYKVINTITENGSVKRGICNIKNNKLISLEESKIEKINNTLVATPLSSEISKEIGDDTLVSMNLLGFPKEFIRHIEENLEDFLQKNIDTIEASEYLIPDVITKQIENKNAEVIVLTTDDKWYGITYKEDKKQVVESIKDMVDKGVYPNKLF
ncbi:MAG: sugar phosphate nucleotidyltransferase [bacterium]|nr:sugar phosphate nucleotidyltransferase [bacterium]